MRKVVIIGATSAIAEATARILAARGDALYLVARNPARLSGIAADLLVRGSAQRELRSARCE
jgi:decaprenylphospho-beta-D-erythro-pentofuranosid-2-ulose 2-reductase